MPSLFWDTRLVEHLDRMGHFLGIAAVRSRTCSHMRSAERQVVDFIAGTEASLFDSRHDRVCLAWRRAGCGSQLCTNVWTVADEE